jgi:hypothetical protein
LYLQTARLHSREPFLKFFSWEMRREVRMDILDRYAEMGYEHRGRVKCGNSGFYALLYPQENLW